MTANGKTSSPSSCTVPLTTLYHLQERGQMAARPLPHGASGPPRGEAWSTMGISTVALSQPSIARRTFLEEGASKLRLEGRGGANPAEEEETFQCREDLCKDTGCTDSRGLEHMARGWKMQVRRGER